MIVENLSTLKIHKLTQEQYERELQAGRIDDKALYLTPDEGEDLSEYAKKNDIPTGELAWRDSISKSEIGLEYVDNVKQYSKTNPPVAVQDLAPTDTKILWVDTTDETVEYESEIKNFIISEISKRGQIRPEFAQTKEWLENNGDQTKLYVLDGKIYAYMLTTFTTPEQELYINVLKSAIDSDGALFQGTGYKKGYRIRSNSEEIQADNSSYTGFIKVNPNGSNVIRIKNVGQCQYGYQYVHGYEYDSNGSFILRDVPLQTDAMYYPDENGIITFTIQNNLWDYIRISTGLLNETSVITINEEIVVLPGETKTEDRWTDTGREFIPADYEDRIIEVENKAETNSQKIRVLEENPKGNDVITMFISPSGNDTNNGLSINSPKKTVGACIKAGATRISAKRGIYAETINLSDLNELEIFPTDNQKTYVVGQSRTPIIFDTSETIPTSSVVSYNSIKRVAYDCINNTAYNEVFVKKTLSPTVSASQSSYHAALWLFSEDEKTVCKKPKPVLTVSECESESNTFCYSDGYIYINSDLTNVAKIVASTITTNGFYAKGINKLTLKEVEVRYSGEYSFDLRECSWVELNNCSSKYTTRASGFHPVDTNGIFRACYATKCFDGFAPNGHGHTTYLDCVSEYNYDDGMSHHSGTEGTVVGGRYEGNGKGGNSPAYGAKVNIYGGLYRNNAQWGIGYVGSAEAGYSNGMIQDSVLVDNAIGLVVQENCTVTALNCKYVNNSSKTKINGTLIEY